jgi:hypothetical protein
MDSTAARWTISPMSTHWDLNLLASMQDDIVSYDSKKMAFKLHELHKIPTQIWTTLNGPEARPHQLLMGCLTWLQIARNTAMHTMLALITLSTSS